MQMEMILVDDFVTREYEIENFVESIKESRLYSDNCLVLTGEKYNSYLQPCIYGWRDEGGWLYIGKSFRGAFNRLDAHRRDKDISDSCQIFIWFFHNLQTSNCQK